MILPVHNHNWNLYFILPLLYAEIHYTIRGLYSRLKLKEPEIIFDMPERLEPRNPLPVLLIIKDAHRYPVEIDSLTVTAEVEGKKLELYHEEFSRLDINQQYWDRVFYIHVPENLQNTLSLDAQLSFFSNKKQKIIHNDNYRLGRHCMFKVQKDDFPLPKTEGWYYGDLHYHSNYTNDQVEFGASLPATVKMALAMGLSFSAVTDHSYDLDDKENDYLHNDPALKKWKDFCTEVKFLNRKNDGFILIPGEEVSAGNSKNRNVHLIVLNNPRFIPGYGDSAEKWLKTRPQLSLNDVLRNLAPSSIALAAHPEINPPWLQWLLIRRGKWSGPDYQTENLKGLQVWNGEKDQSLVNGLKKWIELLLQGQKLAVVAGNDAHGNFNRFRQIGLPFFTIKDNASQVFGRAKTAVFIRGKVSVFSIITAISKGRIIITDGPFAEIKFKDVNNKVSILGDTIQNPVGNLLIRALSTPTWGFIRDIYLIIGDSKRQKEMQVQLTNIPRDCLNLKTKTFFDELPSSGYLRLEVRTVHNDLTYLCYTNPIYIQITC
jgi:hypothetical protein